MSQIVQINAATDATTLVGGTVVPSEHYQWKVEVQSTLPDGRVVTYDYEGQFGDWLYQDDLGKWSVVDNTTATSLQKKVTESTDITSTGMNSIVTLQRQGTNDQANVTSLNTQLSQYSTDFQTQSTNFTPWTPQSIYTPSDLTQIHDQIVWILNEMGPVIAGIQALNTWRSAADTNVTNTGNVLDWISKEITGQ